MGVRIEGVISGEDTVKVIFFEENVHPHSLGKIGTLSLDDKRMLSSLDIDEEVFPEGESAGNALVKRV